MQKTSFIAPTIHHPPKTNKQKKSHNISKHCSKIKHFFATNSRYETICTRNVFPKFHKVLQHEANDIVSKWPGGHPVIIQSCFFFFLNLFLLCPFQFKILKHFVTKALKRIYTLFILISLPLQKYIYPQMCTQQQL